MALIELFSAICTSEQLLPDEPMKNHTSFKIGGAADLLILAQSARQVIDIVDVCRQENLPCFVMGNGSNLLVSDKGIDGVVLKLAKGFDDIQVFENGEMVAESGVLLSTLANAALANALSGLEFASGIPGTLGGAVFMNAGAYDGEMKDVVTQVEMLTKDGQLMTFSNADMAFGYRTSAAQKKGGIVLKTWLELSKGDPNAIKAKMLDFNGRRKDKQPLEMPSAGSTFKRPEGRFAGKLIMESGLQGFSVGGAQVSEKHCGFVVNKGGATAQDVLDLIEHVKETVYKKFGIILEPEIRMIGRR